MKLTGSKGTVDAQVGDIFEDRAYGGKWKIERFDDQAKTPSPSSPAGTPTVYCAPLGVMPKYWEKWLEEDGTVGWCGDSVASNIIAGRSALHDAGRGKEGQS